MNPYNTIPYIRYCVYRKCPATGWEISTRTIFDNEFVLITGGSGLITIDGETYTAKSEHMFYFYPGLNHSLLSNNIDPMQFLGIHFSYAHSQYKNSEWTIVPGISPLPLSSSMTVKNYHLVYEIMKELTEKWINKEVGYELICNGLFMELLYYLIEDFQTSNFDYSSKLKMEQVINYIQTNITSKLNIKVLSELVDLSPDYFSRLFKNFSGNTPVKYINQYRVNIAKQMLAEKNMKVKEVSFELGFKDEFYFSKVFKKIEGISPLAFCEKMCKG